MNEQARSNHKRTTAKWEHDGKNAQNQDSKLIPQCSDAGVPSVLYQLRNSTGVEIVTFFIQQGFSSDARKGLVCKYSVF
jgi:hypothetical protein